MCRCILFTILIAPLASADVFRLGDYTSGQQEIEQAKLNIEKAFIDAGHTVEWIALPPERSLREANAGGIDGDIFRLKSAVSKFPNLLPIEVPVHTVEYWVHIFEEKECPQNIAAINRYKPVGAAGLRFFQYAFERSDVGYETTDGLESAYQMLAAGRADYTILPLATAAAYANKYSVNIVPCFDQPLVTENLFTFLHSSHSHQIEKLTASYARVFNGD